MLQSFFIPWGALPRPARVGVGLFFLAGLAEGALMPFFALWAREVAGVPTGTIGLLLGCYAAGELLATPVLGGIADRRGRRPVLILSTAGVGLGFGALLFVHGAWAAAAVLLLIGVFESVLHPTAAAAIADSVPPDAFRRSYALCRTASNAGSALGPALGALGALISLHLVFAGAAGAMLLGTAATAALLPETAGGRGVNGDDQEEELSALLPAFRDRRLAPLLLALAGLGVAASWVEAVLPLYAVGADTLTPAGVGLLFTGAGVLGTVFQMPVSAASARWSGTRVAATSGGLLAAGLLALAASPSLPCLVAAVVLAGFAGMLAGPLVQAAVAEKAPARSRAAFMAALSTVQDLRDAAGPALGTALFAAGAELPWTVGTAVALLAGAGLAVAMRRRPPGVRTAGG